MTVSALKVVAAVAVIAAGASLKFSRYGSAHAAIPENTATDIVGTMFANGWSLTSKAESATETLYDRLSFSKAGCATVVTIAAMGGNAEAAEFFRQRHGGDAAFIQDGEIVSRPSGLRRQFAVLTHHASVALGMQAGPMLPVLAISPAPVDDQDECHGPPASAWQ